jgi:hypothetical protein
VVEASEGEGGTEGFLPSHRADGKAGSWRTTDAWWRWPNDCQECYSCIVDPPVTFEETMRVMRSDIELHLSGVTSMLSMLGMPEVVSEPLPDYR